MSTRRHPDRDGVLVADVQALIVQQERTHHLNHQQLADAAGLWRSSVTHVRAGNMEWVKAETYKALLNLPHLHEIERFDLPVRATRLRLEALAVAGYGNWSIARLLGVKHPIKLAPTFVSRPMVERIIDVCEQVGSDPGPNTLARIHAVNRGWRGEEAYEHEAFYDPEWSGRGALCARARRGKDRLEDLLFLVDCGYSLDTSWRRAGYSSAASAERAFERERARGRAAA